MGGVSSGLASSGLPADGFFRLIAAQSAGVDRVAQVPGESLLTGAAGKHRADGSGVVHVPTQPHGPAGGEQANYDRKLRQHHAVRCADADPTPASGARKGRALAARIVSGCAACLVAH
jgi:hypothetical protein